MTEILFSTAFTLWGAPASWAEVLACGLALWMVRMNMREIHWGWPLAIASSLLYFFVFRHSRLYGDAGLQLFFALVALWGWFEWLRGRRADGAPLAITRLGRRGRWGALVACALLWPAIAGFLLHFTDSDVPWWDAFPTAASLVGQFLLGRKFVENWVAWLAVNLVGACLFAYKGLWLTTLLYTVFALLSIAGWSAWRRRMADAAATVAP
jgi:nicotinamide mononucleotide transporter